VCFCILLTCIGLGSQQTIVAIFSLTAPALDLSYVAVIIARMWYSSEVSFVAGPFTLGRWGRRINIVASSWVLFISVVLFSPPKWPVTRYNMNYGVFVAVLVALFAFGWWRWAGAGEYVFLFRCVVCTDEGRVYTGPRTKDGMQVIPQDEMDDDDDEEELDGG
jgi:hypothetical protein